MSGSGAVEDAATAPPGSEGPDQPPADDLTCAFEYSVCLLFDPLNYDACSAMLEQCKS